MPINWCNSLFPVKSMESVGAVKLHIRWRTGVYIIYVIDGVLIIELINIGNTFVFETYYTKI